MIAMPRLALLGNPAETSFGARGHAEVSAAMPYVGATSRRAAEPRSGCGETIRETCMQSWSTRGPLSRKSRTAAAHRWLQTDV